MATKKPRQLELLKQAPRSFGGNCLRSNPKTKRILSTKEALHLVLKSSFSVGEHSFLQKHNQRHIEQIIKYQAKRFAIKIYHLVNIGNHLHLVIKLNAHKNFNPFIRAVTGLIARHVLRAQRGAPQLVRNSQDFDRKVQQEGDVEFNSLLDKFWDARPFTRLIRWGQDFRNVTRYMTKNINQAKLSFQLAVMSKQASTPLVWGFDSPDPSHLSSLT